MMMDGKLRLRLLALWATLALVAAVVAPAALAQPAEAVLEVAVPSTVRPGEEFQVAVRATNPGPAATQSSISVSFPDRPAVRVISSSPATGANSYARVFNPGDTIYNFEINRSVPAQYPLAELFLTDTWPPGQQRFLTIGVLAPANATAVRVQVRVTFGGGNGRLTTYPAAAAERDQQGFPVAVTQVSLDQAAPSPVPSPTPTVAPSPTASATPNPTPTPLAPTPTPPATNTPAPALVATAAATPSPSPVPTAAEPETAWWASLPLAPLALAAGGLLLLGALLLAALRTLARPRAPATRRLPVVPREEPPASTQATTALPTVGAPATAATVGAPGALPPGYEAAGPPASGRLGPVYRAYQPRLDRYVSLKVIAPALAASEGFAERFATLVPRVARLEHPNIATVLDAGETAGSPFLVTEWVEGLSLREVLARQQGPLPLARALRLVTALAAALDYAHGQLLAHGGMHPGNVIVGLGDSATVTDFGFADLAGPGRAEPLANLNYLAPELFRRLGPDHRADLYALGAIAYEMLTGAPPPPAGAAGPNLPFPPELPAELATVLRRALSAEPAARYQSGREFVDALGKAAGQQG
ncbi:MAG: serine/threonine-protein kinase [Chloroflexota bacterium]